MMLDMKRTFDEVVESQASPEKAQQILGNPFYVALSSSFAGTQEYMAMEKLGQIHRQARGRRQLRPDRGRHPAVALGAGLPRRPRAALALPRRPLHPAAARAGPGAGAADDGRGGADHRRADQDPRHPGAARHADLRGGVRHPLRRVPRAGRVDVRAAAGRPDGVPGRGGAGAGRAARGGVLRRAARGGRDAAGRSRRQPGEPGAPGVAVPDEATAAAARLQHGSRDPRPRDCCGCTPTGPGSWSARPGCGPASPPPTRRCRRSWCRPWPGDVHDLDGLRHVGELLSGT